MAWLTAAAVVAASVGLYLTQPERVSAAELPTRAPDLANGELVFHAGGCAGCHAAPGAKDEARLVLAGGLQLATPFGTFTVPNISPSEEGIGGWSQADFVTALKHGTSPEGQHYYPAFPYTSYARMTDEDLLDLQGYIMTLPPSDSQPPGHALGFPFNIRRGLGLWKLLYLDPGPVMVVGDDPQLLRGRYLVEGPGHCAECHTPRDMIGGLKTGQWLGGAPNPEGPGVIPNITPGGKNVGSWAAADIAYFLETGFTPDFDSVGGSMVEVVANISQLPPGDRDAIAAYLQAIPAIDTQPAATAPAAK